ncbi:hypothetical protein RhiTH_009230 [Rhizoctonia solani]
MEYYQYLEPSQEDAPDPSVKTSGGNAGKVIDPAPILRLLLEPRSLVVTHGVLYTHHLHGISGAHSDVFASSHEDIGKLKAKYLGEERNVELANQADQESRLAHIHLERRTRASLTCRVVEKTSKAAGKLLRLK